MGNKKNRNKDKKPVRKRESPSVPPHTDLKAELEGEKQRFENMVQRNWDDKRSYRKTGFISLGFITDLFNTTDPPKLRLSIEADIERLVGEGKEWLLEDIKIEQLEDYVRTQASKLYAVLLLVGQSQLIVLLSINDHPLTDRIFEQGEHKTDVPYCSVEYLQNNEHLCGFADQIFEKQWYIPPILRQECDPRFPVEWFRFPFISEPKHIGRGGQGQVSKVKIAHGHLDLTSITGYDKGSVVAHKEVDKSYLTEAKVMREVETIRARPHPNIVKFLASFSAGRENPWTKDEKKECLHILFEHADAENMHDWLRRSSAPEPLADVAKRRKHIMESIESIVEAVTHIHRKIGDKIAFHHDLKPQNILRFEGPPGVWKICDFGMANLKHHEETSGTTQGPNNRFGSYDYQPPEYFDNDSPSHGRPFDVWSLGCIILELLTAWKYGWDKNVDEPVRNDTGVETFRKNTGIEVFRNKRGNNTARVSTNRRHTHQPNTSDYSFHNNRNEVNDWISQLRKGEEGDKSFCHLLDLVSEMLGDRLQRIFIWEVHMDLYEVAHPDDSEQQLKNHFRDIAQDSETSLNDLNTENNPLKRAIRKNKHWQVEILRAKKWSVDKPKPTENLNMKCYDTGVHYTTLKTCPHTLEFEKNEFYGRHDMDARIAKGFNLSNCVGLYGISGIGKSHLAYHYVVRFQDTQSKEDKKHTFWVEAGTETRLQETVDGIAKAISLDFSTTEELFPAMKQWLSDAANGPWIMVIDGLDTRTVAAQLEHLLPQDSGQILITTKDRTILIESLEKFLSHKRREACLGVEHLTLSESRLMFQWHNDDVSSDDSEMNDLLESLFSPALIKLLAKYASKNNISTADLHKMMNTARRDRKPMQFPDAMYGDLTQTYLIFEPLGDRGSDIVTRGGLLSRWPSPEFRLLGELSCMDKDEIDLHLVQQVYSDHSKLRQMLGTLENCSFILKCRSSNTVRYCMHETVQDLTRRWVIDNMGLDYLLDLHQNTLLMLAFLYREATKSKADFKKIRRSSYLWKLPYMRHFERFLSLAREHLQASPDFSCTDNMVRAVIMFAQVYLDEGRYDDAICVLEFTHTLYKHWQWRPQLIRHISKAYTVAPLANENESSWLRATTLLEDVTNECIKHEIRNQEQEWRCSIDLANLYSKVSQTEKASRILERLKEFHVCMEQGLPKFIIRISRSTTPKRYMYELAILKCIAQARIHVAKAKCSSSCRITSKELRKAKDGFVLARLAIQDRFRDEDKWASEVDEAFARVLCKINTPKSTSEALGIYKKLLGRLQNEFAAPERSWSQTKEWDLKCRIAHTQLHTKLATPTHVDEAFDTLRSALEFYERVHPKRSEKFDEHTRTCARLLHEAYEKFGYDAEAQDIKMRFALQFAVRVYPDDFDYQDGYSVKEKVIFCVSFLVAFLCVVYAYSYLANVQ